MGLGIRGARKERGIYENNRNQLRQLQGYGYLSSIGSVLGTAIDTLKRALNKGDPITVTGFAIFSLNTRQTRSGRNPKTGEQIKISASKTVKPKPASTLTASLHRTRYEEAGE